MERSRIDVNYYVDNVYFKARGRSLPGVDCWGLVWVLYDQIFNIELPKFNYGYENVTKSEQEVITRYVEKGKSQFIPAAYPKFGDVIVLKLWGVPWHVGFVLDDKEMLHCTKAANCVIERYDKKPWTPNRVNGFYRHRQRD